MGLRFKQSLPRIAAWFLAAVTLALATALIVQCAGIYLTGVAPQNRSDAGVYLQDVYSPAIVAQRFAQIRWLLWLWLAALSAALLLRAVLPADAPAARSIPLENRWALVCARREATPDMQKERRTRRLATGACALVCAAGATVTGLYLLDPSHFASRELESVMGALLIHIGPWLAYAFVALFLLAQLRHVSMLREIEAAKVAPMRQAAVKPDSRRGGAATIVRVALLVCAVALIVLGVCNGGMRDVLIKAINICTECIGLG